MIEKDGKIYVSEEEYESEKKNPLKKEHSSCLMILFSFLIMFVIIFFIVPMIWLRFIIKDEYHIFTKKRIAEMEDKFNITVTDDFELVKYERHSWQGTIYTLEIEGIDDYSEFMENNVNGEITKQDENSEDYVAFYTYEYTKKGYDTDKYYDYRRYIYFYEENDGTYSAKISN